MADLLAARFQMGMSLAFHIIFAVVGIAMPVMMVVAERRWRTSGDPIYLDLAKRWARGTAILFAVGAVSGTVLSFELGLLWPGFMGVDLYDPTGVVYVFLYFHIPLFVLLTLPAMGVVSERLWEAAAVCGAKPRFFWWRIGLPMLLPFLAAGWFLMFVWAISQYGVPLALGALPWRSAIVISFRSPAESMPITFDPSGSTSTPFLSKLNCPARV